MQDVECPTSNSPDYRERTRSPQPRCVSSQDLRGIGVLCEPGPATYSPDDLAQAHHRHFPSATIGRGPGHDLFTKKGFRSPGPCDFSSNDKALGHRRRSSSATIGHGPGHWSRKEKLASPGPASYSPDDRLQAHHRHFPAATFGRSTGHDLQCAPSSSPGPADFVADDRVEARHRRSSSVAIGCGPGHQLANVNPQSSPGPAAYSADDRLLAGTRSFPAATIGHGPGHASVLVPDSTPAPGSYNVANRSFASRHRHTPAVSLDCSGRETASAEERLRFRRADKNSDGKLDVDELVNLMHDRFPDMRVGEVRAIFKAVDENEDGNIDFQELLDYTHSTNPMARRFREKLTMALATPGLSTRYREGAERLQFRKADQNFNGQLDMAEVEALMRHCFHDVKRRDVSEIFRAVDRNHDGKLDFQEVADYTRSTDPADHRHREMFATALASPPKLKSSESHPALKGCASGASTRASSKQSNSSMRRVSSASAVGALIARRANTP